MNQAKVGIDEGVVTDGRGVGAHGMHRPGSSCLPWVVAGGATRRTRRLAVGPGESCELSTVLTSACPGCSPQPPHKQDMQSAEMHGTNKRVVRTHTCRCLQRLTSRCMSRHRRLRPSTPLGCSRSRCRSAGLLRCWTTRPLLRRSHLLRPSRRRLRQHRRLSLRRRQRPNLRRRLRLRLHRRLHRRLR